MSIDSAPDLERRFGALRRLVGDAGYARLRAARFAVVGQSGPKPEALEVLHRWNLHLPHIYPGTGPTAVLRT